MALLFRHKAIVNLVFKFFLKQKLINTPDSRCQWLVNTITGQPLTINMHLHIANIDIGHWHLFEN
jgi:hypothetical protein